MPILLQKSKIERLRKSRESRFLETLAAAILSGANTKVGGRFGRKRCGPSRLRTRSASAVFKIFVLRPKNTFATISAKTGSQAYVEMLREAVLHPQDAHDAELSAEFVELMRKIAA